MLKKRDSTPFQTPYKGAHSQLMDFYENYSQTVFSRLWTRSSSYAAIKK
jgi:hypothetical protein